MTDESSYYDYAPIACLSRHLALTSPVSAYTRAVGHSLAAALGLALFDVDRWVEHDAGCSLERLRAIEGDAGVRLRERAQLARALADRPFGVLTLGAGALSEPSDLERVLTQTTLVAVELSVEEARRALRRGEGAGEAGDPELLALEPLAHRVVPAEGRGPQRMARHLAATLPELAGS